MNDLSRELGGAARHRRNWQHSSTTTYRNHLILGSMPAPLAEKVRQSVALAAHLGGPAAAQAKLAFVAGLHTALLCAAGAAILAAVGVAIFLAPRHDREKLISNHTETKGNALTGAMPVDPEQSAATVARDRATRRKRAVQEESADSPVLDHTGQEGGCHPSSVGGAMRGRGQHQLSTRPGNNRK